MYITAFFTNKGVPATGLTATIRIRDVSDNSLIITDDSMIEVGDGWYKYDFTTYDATKDYAIRCDGGSTLEGNDRYTYGGNEQFDNLLNEIKLETDKIQPDIIDVPENYMADVSNLALEATAQNIKIQTDKIPSDPAETSDIVDAVVSIKGPDDRDNTEIYDNIEDQGALEPRDFNVSAE